MKTHDLKTWLEPFDAMVRGVKTFEVRVDDRGFEEGDFLQLYEWDEHEGCFTGRQLVFKVPYILRGPAFGLPENMVVMSLQRPFTMEDFADVAEMLTGERFGPSHVTDKVFDRYGGPIEESSSFRGPIEVESSSFRGPIEVEGSSFRGLGGYRALVDDPSPKQRQQEKQDEEDEAG